MIFHEIPWVWCSIPCEAAAWPSQDCASAASLPSHDSSTLPEPSLTLQPAQLGSIWQRRGRNSETCWAMLSLAIRPSHDAKFLRRRRYAATLRSSGALRIPRPSMIPLPPSASGISPVDAATKISQKIIEVQTSLFSENRKERQDELVM